MAPDTTIHISGTLNVKALYETIARIMSERYGMTVKARVYDRETGKELE